MLAIRLGGLTTLRSDLGLVGLTGLGSAPSDAAFVLRRLGAAPSASISRHRDASTHHPSSTQSQSSPQTRQSSSTSSGLVR